MSFSRSYAFISLLLSASVILAPLLVALHLLPPGNQAIFGSLLLFIFVFWFLVSAVAIAIFRRQQAPLLAPMSFFLLVLILFALAVLIGETKAPPAVTQFWIPAFVWLYMFYWGTVSWLLLTRD